MQTNVTRKLAEYIAAAKYEDFPKEVVHKAKQLILDNIGCAFGGYVTDNGKALVSFAREMGGKAESTVIGDGSRIACMVAAGVNAQMANILDFDDQSVAGHPGSAIVQTAISLGEMLRASGKEVIEAVVMGYEAVDRIAGGASARPTNAHASQGEVLPGHHASRMSQYAIPVGHHVFGAATAATKILGLNVQQTRDTIGIAGTTAPTFNVRRLTDRPASPTKDCNLWNCATGISAALLARQGFHGPVDYLDGPRGYWALFTDEVDFEAMQAELGERYFITGVRLKPWATCGGIHSSLQLIADIMKEEKIKPRDIAEITVRAATYNSRFPFDGQRPVEIWDAIFSTPWAVAMAVLGYETGPDWYAGERFEDPQVISLSAKVKTAVLPEADKMIREEGKSRMPPVEVEIRARGRAFVRRSQGGARGDMDHPLTDAELKAKFRSLARRALDEERVQKIISTVYGLEDLPRVARLPRLFKRREE